jgi:NAD(P)-dependent dehydrogenase (short-subunit alcohol dehydrogenase family)
MLRADIGRETVRRHGKGRRVSQPSVLRLDGQVAVVTGAGSGIGAGTAEALASCGAHVVLVGRRSDRLEETLASLPLSGSARGVVVTADVRSADDVTAVTQQTLEGFGRIDVLVNNAGTLAHGSFLDESDAAWATVLDTNLGGARNLLRSVGPHMIAAGRGKVVTVSSAFAHHTAQPFASYSTSKAALDQLTRSVAVEWARHGIQVNAVAPGYVETDLNAEARADEPVRERLLRQIPARRFGRATEIGWTVAFLASSLADYITGETLVVDGGWSL